MSLRRSLQLCRPIGPTDSHVPICDYFRIRIGSLRTPSRSLQARSSSIVGRRRASSARRPWKWLSEGKVRRNFLQFGAFLLLLICLGGHIAETFDFWDHTLQTGNDIEYGLVMVVLVASAGFGLAPVATVVTRTVSITSCLLSSFAVSSCCVPPPVVSPCYSPPPPLRI